MRGSTLAMTMALALAGCQSERNFSGRTYIDSFEQVPTDQVDILFVVDNSDSMLEEQEALAEGFNSFVSELENATIDFHIGVISTSQDSDDPDAGEMVGDTPFLTKRDDYVVGFQRRARLGTGGSDKEKGLQAAVHALAPHMQLRQNKGFLRERANMLIVFVSDEDDCSDYGVLDSRPAADCYESRRDLIPVSDLVARLESYKVLGGRLQISAIVGPYDGSCGEEAVAGFRYADAALATGGTLSKICERDWSAILGELGLNALGIVRQFKLTHAADVETIEVIVNDEPVPQDTVNGWTYDSANWIVYFNGDSVPPRGSSITITYTIAPYSEEPVGDLPQ